MVREFDIVVYGATGFTGQFVAKELKYLSENHTPIKFAIAGRSNAGLKKVNESNKLNVPIIVADVSNPITIQSMAVRTSVLINCVGPFRDLGMPVATACAENGTDYLDICGEPEFLELVQLELDAKAKASGATLISSCGFDSVPADVGLEFAVNSIKAKGKEPLSVESFLSFITGPAGLCVHDTTYKCAVEGFGRVAELKKVRKAIEAKRNGLTLRRPAGEKLALQSGPYQHSQFPDQAVLAFPGADASVCRRTQYHHQEAEGTSYAAPYHACYFNVPSEHQFKMTMYGGAFQTLAQWGWGRSLLLSAPSFFTNGVFTHEGPSEEQMKQSGFKMEFIVKPTDKTQPLLVSFSGPDAGYIGTSSLISVSALTLLNAKHKNTNTEGVREAVRKGGVFTPGYAFGGSRVLIDGLETRGFKVEVLEGESQLNGTAQSEKRQKELLERIKKHNYGPDA